MSLKFNFLCVFVFQGLLEKKACRAPEESKDRTGEPELRVKRETLEHLVPEVHLLLLMQN